jgi:hypothetical protein
VRTAGRWPTAPGEKYVSLDAFLGFYFFAAVIDSNLVCLAMMVGLLKWEERLFGTAGCY